MLKTAIICAVCLGLFIAGSIGYDKYQHRPRYEVISPLPLIQRSEGVQSAVVEEESGRIGIYLGWLSVSQYATQQSYDIVPFRVVALLDPVAFGIEEIPEFLLGEDSFLSYQASKGIEPRNDPAAWFGKDDWSRSAPIVQLVISDRQAVGYTAIKAYKTPAESPSDGNLPGPHYVFVLSEQNFALPIQLHDVGLELRNVHDVQVDEWPYSSTGDELVVDDGYPYYIVGSERSPLPFIMHQYNLWATDPAHGQVWVIVPNKPHLSAKTQTAIPE